QQSVGVAAQYGYSIYPIDAALRTAGDLFLADRWAAASGGRAVAAGQRSPFSELVSDVGNYYSLGFTPHWKDRRRVPQIEGSPRRKDVSVRSRREFFEVSGRSDAHQDAQEILLLGGRGEDRRLQIAIVGVDREPHGRWRAHVRIDVPVDFFAWRQESSALAA